MLSLSLAEIAELLEGDPRGGTATVTGVTTDSRAVAPGNLFVALRGPRFDGHDHAASALAAGAAGALLARPVPGATPAVVVDDTLAGLGALGRAWRRRCSARIAAITGSNGKTTVKGMLATILERVAPTLATEGNLNNAIGMPLTLARLDAGHRFGVVEMGANHGGEIDYLTGLAEPDVGVVTNAGPAHLEGFGDLDGVARGKGELFARLPDGATAVINADDPYCEHWRATAGERPVLTFGTGAHCDVRAGVDADGLVLHLDGAAWPLRLALPGQHNIANALAAAAVARVLGVDPATIRAGLEAFQGVDGRLQRRPGLHGSVLLDDTYNANPASLAAGLDVLRGLAPRTWLVLGDMGELGGAGRALHAEAGEQARRAGVERLYALGTLGAEAASAFGPGGQALADREALLAALRAVLDGDVALLVQGSRSMGMERVVVALAARVPTVGEGD